MRGITRMGLLGCIFMMNTLLFCLVYSGLCIVVAPNDDAKIRRWECGLRMGTKIFYIFFYVNYRIIRH